MEDHRLNAYARLRNLDDGSELMALRKTDEEKQRRFEAQRAKNLAEATEAERKRQAQAEETERKRQAEAAEQFRQSPAGQAQEAYQRGDHLFQFEMDVRRSTTYTVPLVKTGAITQATSPSDVLNSIARQGWRLVNASFVFHQTGAESRDKFMASGQHVAVAGSVIGYYVFDRRAGLPGDDAPSALST